MLKGEKMKSLFKLCLAIFVLVFISCSVKTYNHTRYDIDQDFAKKYNIQIPINFSFAVDHENRGYANPEIVAKAGLNEGILSFAFFADKDKKDVMEDVLFFKASVNLEDQKQIYGYIQNFCSSGQWSQTLPTEMQCSPSVEKELTANKYKTIMCAADCQKGDEKLITASYYIMPNNGKDLVHITTNYYSQYSDVKSVQDVPDKGVKGGLSYILKTFEFKD